MASRTVIKGERITRTEYELRFSKKGDPTCYSAFPCDEHGNLLMKDAEKWGKDFLYVKSSEDYEAPVLASRTTTRKEPDLILCGCGKLYLETRDGHGRIICPNCHREHGGRKQQKSKVEEAARKGFSVVKEVAG